MPLFESGEFVLHSGAKATWRIDCESLTEADLATLAKMAADILPPFGRVEGVPRGGLRFAEALKRHTTPHGGALLIADDVCTSGGSLEEHRGGRGAIGVVIFARDPDAVPSWVTPLFVCGGVGT